VPTVVVTTTRFVDLTRRVADNFGSPHTRIVVVDHPLGGTDVAVIEAWADAAVERLVALFTGALTGAGPAGGAVGVR
jgi:hypothetical protein